MKRKIMQNTTESRNERFFQPFRAEKLTGKTLKSDKYSSWHSSVDIDEIIKFIRTRKRNRLMRFFLGPARISCKILLVGSKGTGKDLAAAQIGAMIGRDVFRIDLSRVVSKFIGETEKNLSRLFDKAENKDWILFFDEADALFGKRTNVREQTYEAFSPTIKSLFNNFTGLIIVGIGSDSSNNIKDGLTFNFVLDVREY